MDIIPPSSRGVSALDTAIKAAYKSGQLIKKHASRIKEIKKKGRNNLVSELDIASETIICKILREAYPDSTVISEESFSKNAAYGLTWIIDPLDGTTNSIFGIPFICVNIALVYNNIIHLGVTYDPIREEMFTSQKSRGAYLNQKRIRVSKTSSINNALIGVDLGYETARGHETLEMMQKLWGRILSLRILGSAALGMAYVACGRINLYYHRSSYSWDISSGISLVSEAGGRVVSLDYKEAKYDSKGIIAANRDLIAHFIRLKKGLPEENQERIKPTSRK